MLDAVRLDAGADVAAVTTVRIREGVERRVAVSPMPPGPGSAPCALMMVLPRRLPQVPDDALTPGADGADHSQNGTRSETDSAPCHHLPIELKEPPIRG